MSAVEHDASIDDEVSHVIRKHRFDNFSILCKNGKKNSALYNENVYGMMVIQLRFYANGDCDENKGYVSIIIYAFNTTEFITDFSLVEFNCTASVIDATGKKRFMQSFAYLNDPNIHSGSENIRQKFSFERFVRRKTLMNDPDELVPGDCLTICVEFYCTNRTPVNLVIESTFLEDDDTYYLNLDSPLGEQLRKVSKFFQCASDSPMIENKTRRVSISNDKWTFFYYIYIILSGFKELNVRSIAWVQELYVLANKYDIQLVIETCREIFKSFLLRIDDPTILEHTEKSIPMILDLAETYEDGRLKDTIETYLESKKNFEANDYALVEHLKKNLVTNWKCNCWKFIDWHNKFDGRYRFPIFELTRIEDRDGQEIYLY